MINYLSVETWLTVLVLVWVNSGHCRWAETSMTPRTCNSPWSMRENYQSLSLVWTHLECSQAGKRKILSYLTPFFKVISYNFRNNIIQNVLFTSLFFSLSFFLSLSLSLSLFFFFFSLSLFFSFFFSLCS